MSYVYILLVFFILIANFIFIFALYAIDEIRKEIEQNDVAENLLRGRIIKFYDYSIILLIMMIVFDIAFVLAFFVILPTDL